jgi:hypothetical protein
LLSPCWSPPPPPPHPLTNRSTNAETRSPLMPLLFIPLRAMNILHPFPVDHQQRRYPRCCSWSPHPHDRARCAPQHERYPPTVRKECATGRTAGPRDHLTRRPPYHALALSLHFFCERGRGVGATRERLHISSPFGNPAACPLVAGPKALRPRLAAGLPFSRHRSARM